MEIGWNLWGTLAHFLPQATARLSFRLLELGDQTGLREKPFPNEAARPHSWKAGEDAAARMQKVATKRVIGGEAPLYRYELSLRITLERNEEQAGIELPGARLRGFRKGEAAA